MVRVADEEDVLGSLAGVSESGRVAGGQRRTGTPCKSLWCHPVESHHSSWMCESTPR